jgi:hypothetical protein
VLISVVSGDGSGEKCHDGLGGCGGGEDRLSGAGTGAAGDDSGGEGDVQGTGGGQRNRLGVAVDAETEKMT